jgi:hypothetical protein
VIEYEEGKPAPDGYRLETRASRPMVTTGAVILGISAAAGALLALVASSDGDSMATAIIPGIGPFIAAASNDKGDGASDAPLVLSGIGQLLGIGLLAIGANKTTAQWERVYPSAAKVRVTPMVSGGRSGFGVGLGGTF